MSFWTTLKKFWNYVWYADTAGSFVLNILFAFLVIRFIVYPLLGLVLGTSYPIVAVVSGSMEHDGSFDAWWQASCCQDALCLQRTPQSTYYESRGISKETFQSFPFKNGFQKGDIMVLVSANDIKVGDVIVFVGRTEPIIHRVTSYDTSTAVFQTKGDHNCIIADFEHHIEPSRILGKALFRIPYLGYIKIIFVDLLALGGVHVL